MVGISSQALKGNDYSPNRKKFNDIEETRDLDLNQYDAFFRTLDPQIGRWFQIDPKPTNSESPYASMGGNPILYSDLLGDTLSPQQLQKYYEMGIVTKPKNKNGDQSGIIKNATEEEYDENPVMATGKDVSHLVFSFLGVNEVDDFVQDRRDGKNTPGEIVAGLMNVGLATSKGEKGTKQGGKITEPTLPDKTIGISGEVEIVHYTRSGDHGPPHVHVKGGGKETKIGQNGNPIKGASELTAQQKQAVQELKADIRKAVKQIMKWFDYNNK